MVAFFDRFKKHIDKTSDKPVGAVALRQKKKEEPKEVSPTQEGKKMVAGVLLRAHITEKTARAQKSNVYVFAIAKRANKFDITRAVQGKYGVTVKNIRTLHANPKERRRGRIVGWKPGFKKAMVTIKEGQKIEIQ